MADDENNNSIDNLIEYSESDEGDTPEEIVEFDEEIIDEEIAEALPEIYEENTELATEDSSIDEIDVPHSMEERVSENRKKRKHRGGLIGAVIGILIGIVIVFAFISIDSGIIGTYKTNFANNFSRIFGNFVPEKREPRPTKAPASSYKSAIKSSIIVAPEDMAEAVITPFKEGVICAVTNHMSYIDASGETVWEMDTAVVDPLVAAEGNYILLAEKGRNKLCLYSDRRLVYDTDDPDNIMAVKVSARGDAALVTDKSSYRGGISVYNKSGEQIYSWASGRDTVISADISSASRRVAVALLNTEVKAKSVVQLFDVNQTQSYSQISIDDTVIYNVEFSGSMLTAFGDNRLVTFTDGGKVITDITLTDGELCHSAMDSAGNKLLALDGGTVPTINLYTRRGAQRGVISTGTAADFIDIDGKTVLYSTGRDIYFGKMGSKSLTKYTATMDIKNLILLGSETYVIVYSNSMEIIKV